MTFNTLYEIVKHSVEKFAERIAFSMMRGTDAMTVGRTLANAGMSAEAVGGRSR